LASNHRLHVTPLIGHRVVHAAPELSFDLAQFRLPVLANRFAPNLEPSLPGLCTEVRQTQEVDGLRFGCTTLRSRRGCESAELVFD
jgi:hypothetical protein